MLHNTWVRLSQTFGLVVIQLSDGLADGGLIQELLLVDQASHQSGSTHLVDAARQAFCVLV